MKGAAKELGFSADVDPAVLEREVKKSIHFESASASTRMARGLAVFERVPELVDKFKAIGTSDQRKREICDVCHLKAMPLLKKGVGDHYDFFSREDIHRNGTLAEKAQVQEAAPGGRRRGREDRGEGRVGLNYRGTKAALRLDIEKLQKKLVSLGAPPGPVGGRAVVVLLGAESRVCGQGTISREEGGAQGPAPRPQRAMPIIEEYNTGACYSISTWGRCRPRSPAGLRLERARKGRLGIALDGRGESDSEPERARRRRAQAGGARGVGRARGAGAPVDPGAKPAPAPPALVEGMPPPPPFSPESTPTPGLAAGAGAAEYAGPQWPTNGTFGAEAALSGVAAGTGRPNFATGCGPPAAPQTAVGLAGCSAA